ncbi:MAG: hypothetical protein JW828_04395 [Sedimentisphaerales bacterium]|nr:hypothetical protein [Sedimentisphaerales bacterium]
MKYKNQVVNTAAFVSWYMLFILPTIGMVHAQVESTFDTDVESWLVTGDNSAAWEATTGNPGGCLSVNDHATGDMNYIVAPPKYHGDWSGMTATDSLSAQIFYQHLGGGYQVYPAYIFRIAGPGGSAYTMVGESFHPTEGAWTTYTAYLNPADWVIETGDWNAILSNINSVRITGEYYNGTEIVRLDNVHLTSTPVKAFIPCAYDDFNTGGTGDWSFANTGGVSNPGSGGNGGGYLSIADKAGVLSVALAPAKFLGDWSSLDGSGIVTADLRIVRRGGTAPDISEFIRISGPGGSAFVPIEPAAFPESSLVWKTFTYPIDASAWTVDSGTWQDLLQDVSECRIVVEFYDGTDTIGLDNFGRMASDCSSIDNTVQLHDPAVGSCGYHSMVNLSSVAYDLRDNELYGLVRETAGSGGGLYPVTGPDRGIRIQSYDRPAHLIFDTNGNAFVSEDYGGNVYRKEYNGPSGVWVSGFHSGDDDPYGMTFAPIGFNGPSVKEGDILITDRGAGGPDQIWSFSTRSPENEQLVMPDPGETDQWDLTADPDGKVYLCDSLNADNLYSLDPDGILTPLPLNISVSNLLSIVYDSIQEQIYVAGGSAKAVYRVDPSSGEVTLVADGFRNFHPCCLEIDPPNRRLWVADNGYNRVYEFCLDGGVPVNVAVGLQGPSRPDPAGWQIPLFVAFYLPGADVLEDPAVYYCRPTTTKTADSAVAQVPGIAPGAYDVAAAGEYTLLNVRRSVVVAEPTASVDMGLLLEGNANRDNRIDLGDFAALASAWSTTETTPAFTESADFDRNKVIDLQDVALLISTWLTSSPIELP